LASEELEQVCTSVDWDKNGLVDVWCQSNR